MLEINAGGMYYRDLNQKIRDAVNSGEKDITVRNVNGQYYIGDGLRGKSTITVEGVPGNDLAAFMDGPTLVIKANAQDNISNTMNTGKVVIHGNAGDVLGYGMRGGKLHILGDVGYRVGIHMKGVKKQSPTIVVGGTAGDFFGEYMAGGVLILLGLNNDGRPIVGDYLGTGMHGGDTRPRRRGHEGPEGIPYGVLQGHGALSRRDNEKGVQEAYPGVVAALRQPLRLLARFFYQDHLVKSL